MPQTTLYQAVSKLAFVTSSLSEAELGQPWQWHAHKEGIRFALIGTYHELRDLALLLHQKRFAQQTPMTTAQHALAQHHAAFRDLQAVLLNGTDSLLDQAPAPGEWNLRRILAHVVYVECFFFTLIHDGLLVARTGAERPSLSNEQIASVIPNYKELDTIIDQPTYKPLMAFYNSLHQLAWESFASITDNELQAPSPWWEGEPMTLAWRLHRFDAHLREHTIQIEKTLSTLEVPLPEGKRQLRLIFKALADVESLTIGINDLCLDERTQLANKIEQRAEEVTAVLQQVDELVTAVNQNNHTQINKILSQNPSLVDARDPNQLPITLAAIYQHKKEIANLLVEKGAHLDLFTAAAIGNLERVQSLINSGYMDCDQVNLDGFNPLQLACFFNQEPIALWLTKQGANVNAAAQNKTRICPVHAAAAGGNLTILEALLTAGANANAQQEGGFTPLHTAAKNNNQPMTAILLMHGADPNITNDQGQIPHELSIDRGGLTHP